MPTVKDFTDPYVSTYVPPPPVGDGVCATCHGWTGVAPLGDRYYRCESCTLTRKQVSRPLNLVVPISLYVVGEQLHEVLRGYKDSADRDARKRHRRQVASLLGRFLHDHWDCVQRAAGREPDTLTIVPSGRGREGVHPLESAIGMVAGPRDLYRPLLVRTDAPLGHRHANEDAFGTADEVGDRRVLLIDDTFTSGAALQSAASRLALDGADVVGAVVVGRVIDPGYADEAKALWDRQEKIEFDFASCCVH